MESQRQEPWEAELDLERLNERQRTPAFIVPTEGRAGGKNRQEGQDNGSSRRQNHSSHSQPEAAAEAAQAKLGYGGDRGARYIEKGSLMRQCR